MISSMADTDIEKGDTEEAEDAVEEENDEEKRRQEEEDNKKKKERQEILELVHVFIAFAIIIGMAVGIVVLDNVLFPEEEVITFIPLDQKVDSTKKVTGNGFIPCKVGSFNLPPQKSINGRVTPVQTWNETLEVQKVGVAVREDNSQHYFW